MNQRIVALGWALFGIGSVAHFVFAIGTLLGVVAVTEASLAAGTFVLLVGVILHMYGWALAPDPTPAE